MVKVLFVCLGNICRSPMAEAVFRHKVKEAGLEDKISVDSAGTGHWHIGEPPHEGTRRILSKNGINYSGIKARQISADDLEAFDYIVAMDEENVRHLKQLALKEHHPKIVRLLEFLPDSDTLNVPDPYFTGNFEYVYQLINESCDHLLRYIRQREQL
ncbi:protein tyrosine phosphatase [Caldalkalibacillus thermarum TA2.A1]|uniref:protein-tyrosine-phosphatase n=1 Tax=Caldalkalibacillus thermarum (strain TA2.A1) TaxID=986075 RepID=F5L5M2_CALTT|nr:low molecular weight protein-tyrosine-phosphatase [Caldalkalibacillus thermarum]EGL83378.1 protein tyrosine phosphatase [Caldalkalibacillus thermarum TA2.A1]QZT32863.1 low molecular weight phosphotyrosine protein phosphatase [Caldalkalibacillus thermarum TA2.A1]GGK14700.1 phosphotyrosine protein phosphatase [Caldalkalibacillus thermarum]